MCIPLLFRRRAMPKFTGYLHPKGGAVVRVRLTAAHRGGVPVEGIGLIDTGASRTSIDERTVRRCRCRATEKTTTIHSALGNPRKVSVYEIRLDIQGGSGEKYTDTLEMPIFKGEGQPLDDPPDNPFIALIGMDVLRRGHFTLDGPQGIYQLDLP